MDLLERETELQQLAAAFDLLAGGGPGTCALVLGEAGVGKTSLVRGHLAGWRTRADIYWGASEALFTPRPLGPISDFAAALPPGLAAQVHEGSTHNGFFPAFLAFLRARPRPAVLVIDDAHWADEATLDFIKYIGRRIETTRALMVVTVRDDEVGIGHPLRRVLGDLTTSFTRRIKLAPLSRHAVERLAAGAGRDADAVYRLTGGNPFYVSELLGAPGTAVPASVRDAVLARFGRLSAAAKRVVELVSIEPGRMERAVVEAAHADSDVAIHEACDAGMLRIDANALAFRHEIGRCCIEQELGPQRRAQLHAQVLDALRLGTVGPHSLSREVHHAIGAGRTDDVCTLAPRAAQEAAQHGSHREAATLYQRALATQPLAQGGARADLLEAAANELQKTGQLQEAIDARLEALALRRAADDRLREGINLRLLGVLHRQSKGDKTQYLDFARRAVEVLEPLGPSGELAKAYATLTHVYCLLSEFELSTRWGRRAVHLAEQSGDVSARALALTRHATAELYRSNDPQSRAQLERALALAIDARFEGLAAEIHISMQTGAIIHHDHAFALDIGRRGIAYCEARDLDGSALALRCRCAYSLLCLGRWDEGEAAYASCAAAPQVSELVRTTCEYALRRQHVRRGALPSAAGGLVELAGDIDAFWAGMQARTHTMQVEFKPPAIAAACAEAAWLRGDLAAARDAARTGLADALATGDGRLAGPLLVWLKRFGEATPRYEGDLPVACAEELAGNRAAAAAEWDRLRNPYEHALVLAFGAEGEMRVAVNRFAALGAARAAAATRNRLRACGARGIERGPYEHARSHAFGFTRREHEVAELLCQGLANSTIAQKLQRSERTVEHHVARVLAKLGVASRGQALVKLSNLRQTAEN